MGTGKSHCRGLLGIGTTLLTELFLLHAWRYRTTCCIGSELPKAQFNTAATINESLLVSKNIRGLKFSLLIWSYPFVEIYFLNHGTNIVSFEIVRTKKNILSKCF